MLRFHNPTDFWKGVYECGRNLGLAGEGSTSNHPTPGDEGRHMAYEEYCGFLDENQLLNWFPHYVRLRGVVLSRVNYEPWGLIVLKHQVLLHRSAYISHEVIYDPESARPDPGIVTQYDQYEPTPSNPTGADARIGPALPRLW